MRFRLISKSGEAIPLVYKLIDEGHSCDVWLNENRDRYKDLPQPESWNVGLQSDMFILVDYPGIGKLVETLKSNGYSVFGGGILNDRFQLDYDFGHNLAVKFNMEPIEAFQSKDFNKVLEWVGDGTDRRFLPKTGNIFSASDTVEGQEIITSAFFIDGKPMALYSRIEFNENTVLRFWKKICPKIYKLTIKRVEPLLLQFRFSGIISCHTVISKGKPRWLAWDTRLGHRGLWAMIDALNQPLGEWLVQLFRGKTKKPSYSWFGCNGQYCDEKKRSNIIRNAEVYLEPLRRWKYI